MLLDSVAQHVVPQPAVLQQLGQMGCFPSKASQSRPETWRATGTISLRDAKLKVHLLCLGTREEEISDVQHLQKKCCGSKVSLLST